MVTIIRFTRLRLVSSEESLVSLSLETNHGHVNTRHQTLETRN